MGSELPVRALTGHLVWAPDGSVWACFQVEPFGFPHRSTRDATDIHARTQAALLALPAEALVLSIGRRLSPAEITDRIATAGGGQPGWVAYARRAAATPAYTRMWVLAVQLPDPDGTQGWMDRLRAATSEVGAGVGAVHTPPGARRVKTAFAAARAVEEELARHITLRPLPALRVRWLYEHAVTRGLIDPPLPDPTPLHPTGDMRPVVVRRWDRDTVYIEGGTKTDPGRPRHRRYLTVEHPDYGTAYQTFLCLGELPAAWTFPYGSGEWLWHLDDQVSFPVDWALRITRVSNETARRRVLRARRNLTGQLDEPGGDPAGPSTTIASAADAVDHQRARLEANPALPAFKATTIVAVADRDLPTLERRASLVETTFRQAEFNFYRPTGGQHAAHLAMLPGSPISSVVGEYAQDLLPDGLASAMPFAGSGVGDPDGMLLGACLDTLVPSPVFMDPAHAPRDLNRSGSLAAIGELGAGKSFLAKTLAYRTVAMGGRVVAVDRTERGEYAALADVAAGTSQVVEVTADAQVCLDPFQVFTTDQLRLRYGVGFLTLLTATPPGSTAGALCHRAAHRCLEHAAATGATPRLVDVIDALAAEGAGGEELARKLQAMSGIAEAGLVLGDPGPPLDLDADYVCFHLPGLRLPARGTARDELLPEELIGQAVLYLVAAFSRRVLFSDPHRFAALLLDEAHALTTNPQGRALVTELIRDGRKHFAAVWGFSQLPADFTTTGDSGEPGGLEALLGYRVAFRQSRHTAAAALTFLGSDDREGNLDTVTGLGTGECLLRDPTGRLGVVRISPPDDPAVLAAFSTTPTETPDVDAVWEPWPSLTQRAANGDRHTTKDGNGNGQTSIFDHGHEVEP